MLYGTFVLISYLDNDKFLPHICKLPLESISIEYTLKLGGVISTPAEPPNTTVL